MADEIDTNTQTPQTEAPQEPILAPEPAVEPQTAQIPASEPFELTEDKPLAPVDVPSVSEEEPEPPQTSGEANAEPEKEEVEISEPEPIEKPEPKPETHSEPNTNSAKVESSVAPVPVVIPPQNKIRELLTKARNAIQSRKRKKLEKIMTLFAKQTNITNDEVEKLLHVSDATATRYLTILKKENKIKQLGKTGKGVSYSKI